MTTPIAWDAETSSEYVRMPDASSHKYSRGVLGLRTGSSAYPGAAVLGAEAAWRAGVGLVRYVSPLDDEPPSFELPSPAAAVLAARPETVFTDGYAGLKPPCDAWLVGSGTNPKTRSFAERDALRRIFSGEAPVVADAGALTELTSRRDSDRRTPIVATPHSGEFRTLWVGAGFPEPPPGWVSTPQPELADLADAALELAGRMKVTVLLKGSQTIAATPGGFCAVIGPATPWLATAGTGDVLAGILGALVTTHADDVLAEPELLGPLAATASFIHDRAARHAIATVTSETKMNAGAPITALDVAQAIPAAVTGIIRDA